MPTHEKQLNEPPLTLRVSHLTGEQHDWLCRVGCTCVPIPHTEIGHPYQVTFPAGTRREALPRLLDRRRVNRNFVLTLPNGRTIDEVYLPSHESVLFPTTPTHRASATRAARPSDGRRNHE